MHNDSGGNKKRVTAVSGKSHRFQSQLVAVENAPSFLEVSGWRFCGIIVLRLGPGARAWLIPSAVKSRWVQTKARALRFKNMSTSIVKNGACYV